MENIPPDQYALYAEFGLAAEKAQLLEVEAGNVALSFLALFIKPDEISTEQREMFRRVNEDVNSKTLGALLRSIKSIVDFNSSILLIIDEALERRNYLTHHFFRTHNFAMYSEAGRKQMVEEIRDIQAKIDLAYVSLQGLSSAMEKIRNKLTGASIDADIAAKKLEAQGKQVKI